MSFPPASPEYYNNALHTILKEYPKTTSYVFSDDPQWCNTHLTLATDFIVVSGNYTNSAIEDLLLMNSCTHNILANSSFSWWGASLPKIIKSNTHIKKVIIAPNTWSNNNITNKYISPHSWLRISN